MIKYSLKNIVILVLIASNVFVLGLNLRTDNTQRVDRVDMYTLDGKGDKWNVRNYNILKTNKEIIRGSAELSYLGDSEDLKNSNHFSCTFYEDQGINGSVAVFSKSISGWDGSANILENSKKTGTIKGAVSEYEKSMTKENFETSYLTIEWNNKQGEVLKERIRLSVVDNIQLNY